MTQPIKEGEVVSDAMNAGGNDATEIAAQIRTEDEIGTRPSRRLRRSGYIPAVVYGREVKSIPIKLNVHEVYHKLGRQPQLGTSVTLVIRGETGERRIRAILKEVQIDPLSLELLSLDFHQVVSEEVTATEVEEVAIPATET